MKLRAYFLVVTISLLAGVAIGLMLAPLRAAGNQSGLALWLELVHRVCTSVGGLGTFVALIFVIRQFNLLRAQSDLLQRNIAASMDSELYARLDSFNRFIVEHYQEYGLLDDAYQAAEPTELRSKLHHLCDLGITFYEESYKHHVRYKLLDSKDWDESQRNMAHFFGKPYVQGYWKSVAQRYSNDFRVFVNALIERMAE